MNKHSQGNKKSDKSVQYISMNMPLSYELLLEDNYIEKRIYTFIYDSDRIVKRIIFTDQYYSEYVAKSDYDLLVKNNNCDNDFNMPKKILKLNKNIITYEYEDDILKRIL